MRLAGNQNESEIGNSATRRCDWGGATRGSWVRGPIVGSWVRRSWVVGSPFVGSLFMGHGFAVRGLVGSWVRRSWVQRSPVDDLTGGATISTFWVRDLSLSLFARESFLSLFLSLRVSGNDLKRKFGLKIISVGESSACACAW